jgi:putative PIG3 family NAD(P)H quinone oxidoreductase
MRIGCRTFSLSRPPLLGHGRPAPTPDRQGGVRLESRKEPMMPTPPPALPQTMSAVAITKPGGPEVLQLTQLATPRPGPGQALVKVAAAGVNRPDVAQRQGVYPPPPGHSPLPGLEIAGEVVEVGPETTRWKPGDKVCALVNGGGYAEYCIAEETSALPVPAGFDLVRAAALPETFFTVWNNVFDRGRLAAGEWLMVHGGSSGIGTTAIQLAKALGAHVLATAGSDEKCKACLDLGADKAVNYKTEDFVAAAKAATGGKGIDVTLDMVGGEYTEKNIVAAAEDGRIVQIATLGGAEAKLNLARLMTKRVTLTGSTLRPRSREVKAGFARAIEQKVWPLLAAGRIKVVLDSTFPLAHAADAHRRLESSQHIGKIVLTV